MDTTSDKLRKALQQAYDRGFEAGKVQTFAEINAELDRINTPTEADDVRSRSIKELELPERVRNCLKRARIATIGDLLDFNQAHKDEYGLCIITNFGKKSFDGTAGKLKEMFDIDLPYYG